MTYDLLIGDRSYSSWSLRGWLPFALFDIPVRTQTTTLYTPRFPEDVRAFGGTGTVPVAKTPEGHILSDSLAIAWHLAERFPEKELLPADPAQRALALSMISEMHSGFAALRGACPMNLRTAWDGFDVPEAVRADVDRVEALWAKARALSGGPFLFGAPGLADAFYAPVATRLASYKIAVTAETQAYVDAILALPAFRRWRAMGIADGPEQANYEMGLPRAPFPAPPTLDAEAVADGPASNTACPYSGKPVTHFARVGAQVYGFCNAFCRDKTVADPEAWPQFMKIYVS